MPSYFANYIGNFSNSLSFKKIGEKFDSEKVIKALKEAKVESLDFI